MKKILNSLFLRIFIISKQKTFRMENGKVIKYLFLRRKSNELVIAFSGFSGEGKKPKYNYIRTLKDINKNQIYILDDFGYCKAGSYYLGEKGDYFLEKEIPKLINNIKKKYNITKTYTIGTSKGGWASLYYGIMLEVNTIICGAPQYYIFDYLETKQYHKKILKGIIGELDYQEQKDVLNNKLSNMIKNNTIENIKFIIHYSTKEHTYNEHIQYLLKDLKNKTNNVHEDIKEYLNHNEVGNYFKLLIDKNLKGE